jgi:anti-sigma regulatory factor (Ser/Thr protein kinase)
VQDTVRLPADGRAAGQARRLVQERLAEWGLTALCDTALLLTTELVTNVLLHTTSEPRVTISRSGTGVRVAVADDSAVVPSLRRPSQGATTGRGVRLVLSLADDWGWQLDADGGKSVWFVLTGDVDPWAAFATDRWLQDERP